MIYSIFNYLARAAPHQTQTTCLILPRDNDFDFYNALFGNSLSFQPIVYPHIQQRRTAINFPVATLKCNLT